jgi:hypothetical protein
MTGRSLASATLLVTGKVLVAGGIAQSGVTAVAELYDRSTGTFSATTPLVAVREGRAATRLADGTVLITGDASGTVLSSSEFCFRILRECGARLCYWTPAGRSRERVYSGKKAGGCGGAGRDLRS